MELQGRPNAGGFAGAGRVLANQLRAQLVIHVVDGHDLRPVLEQPLALVALSCRSSLPTLATGPVDSRDPSLEKAPASGPVVVRRRVRPAVPYAGAGRLLSYPAPRARPHPPSRSVHRSFPLPLRSLESRSHVPLTFHRRTACPCPSGIQQPTPVDPNVGRAGSAAEFRPIRLWQGVRRWNPVPRVFPRDWLRYGLIRSSVA